MARRPFAVVLLCAAGAAHALDIPMAPALAAERLDSKTCYSTLTSDGRLVGYELNDLLVSHHHRLLALAPTAAFESGDGTRRTYAGSGMTVTLAPASISKTVIDKGVSQVIVEQGVAEIVEDGRRRSIALKIRTVCSP